MSTNQHLYQRIQTSETENSSTHKSVHQVVFPNPKYLNKALPHILQYQPINLAMTSPFFTVLPAGYPFGTEPQDPISASFRLYGLIDVHDKTLEQVQALDAYILDITEKIVKDTLSNRGHVGHGLLLLNRKCVAEGMRDVFVKLANRKWHQVRECYNYILSRFDTRDDRFANLDDDVVDDHEVVNIARGLSMECCTFQRGC